MNRKTLAMIGVGLIVLAVTYIAFTTLFNVVAPSGDEIDAAVAAGDRGRLSDVFERSNKAGNIRITFFVIAALEIVGTLVVLVSSVRKRPERKPGEGFRVESVPSKPDLATIEARIAAGLCPKCGSPVAPTDENCPSCRINLAWARQNLGQSE